MLAGGNGSPKSWEGRMYVKILYHTVDRPVKDLVERFVQPERKM